MMLLVSDMRHRYCSAPKTTVSGRALNRCQAAFSGFLGIRLNTISRMVRLPQFRSKTPSPISSKAPSSMSFLGYRVLTANSWNASSGIRSLAERLTFFR